MKAVVQCVAKAMEENWENWKAQYECWQILYMKKRIDMTIISREYSLWLKHHNSRPALIASNINTQSWPLWLTFIHCVWYIHQMSQGSAGAFYHNYFGFGVNGACCRLAHTALPLLFLENWLPAKMMQWCPRQDSVDHTVPTVLIGSWCFMNQIFSVNKPNPADWI